MTKSQLGISVPKGMDESASLSKQDRIEISKVLKEKGLLPAGTNTIELFVSPEGVVGNVSIRMTLVAKQ